MNKINLCPFISTRAPARRTDRAPRGAPIEPHRSTCHADDDPADTRELAGHRRDHFTRPAEGKQPHRTRDIPGRDADANLPPGQKPAGRLRGRRSGTSPPPPAAPRSGPASLISELTVSN